MSYTIKGKIKRFLELTFIGKNQMAKDIVEQILNAQGGEIKNQKWSHKNISYEIQIDNDGFDTTYYVKRRGRNTFAFDFTDGEFNFSIKEPNYIYRLWKELV